jgi:hypothetical protein
MDRRQEIEATEKATERAAHAHAVERADREGRPMAVYRCRRTEHPDVFYVRPTDDQAPGQANFVEVVEPTT